MSLREGAASGLSCANDGALELHSSVLVDFGEDPARRGIRRRRVLRPVSGLASIIGPQMGNCSLGWTQPILAWAAGTHGAAALAQRPERELMRRRASQWRRSSSGQCAGRPCSPSRMSQNPAGPSLLRADASAAVSTCLPRECWVWAHQATRTGPHSELREHPATPSTSEAGLNGVSLSARVCH